MTSKFIFFHFFFQKSSHWFYPYQTFHHYFRYVRFYVIYTCNFVSHHEYLFIIITNWYIPWPWHTINTTKKKNIQTNQHKKQGYIKNMCCTGKLLTNFYDKRDEFSFKIVNFPFICGNIPSAAAYGVFIELAESTQTFCILTNRLLEQGYVATRLK